MKFYDWGCVSNIFLEHSSNIHQGFPLGVVFAFVAQRGVCKTRDDHAEAHLKSTLNRN